MIFNRKTAKLIFFKGLGFTVKTGNLIYPRRNEAPIIISGSPRGGTTWLAESIAAISHSPRIIYEPLQDGNIYKNNCGFSKRPFVDESNVTPEAEDFFDKLLRAELANTHTLGLRISWKNIISTIHRGRLIIKFVRGNGVVGYLKRRFNVPKPLVIVRHPCAVIASQLRMGTWNDHPHIDKKFLEIYPYLNKVIDVNAGLVDRLAMTWAADVLAAKHNINDINLIYYEDLVVKGHVVLQPALKSWGKMTASTSEIDHAFSFPSSSRHSWSELGSMNGKLARWRNDLDNQTVLKIIDIVQKMGVQEYTDEIFPELNH